METKLVWKVEQSEAHDLYQFDSQLECTNYSERWTFWCSVKSNRSAILTTLFSGFLYWRCCQVLDWPTRGLRSGSAAPRYRRLDSQSWRLNLQNAVGCKGGSRYFEEYHQVWRSQRFKKLIFQKYQDSTIHHQSFKKYRVLFKINLDLWGFTYVLSLSTIIQDLLRFHHRVFRFDLKRLEITIVLDPPFI